MDREGADGDTRRRCRQFASFVAPAGAQTFPTVKDYVIGNEPNQPRFWLPQYRPAGKPLAAAQYLPVLAHYDALKAVDPTINVIGIGLSPRGNDQPIAPATARARRCASCTTSASPTARATARSR